MVFRKGYLSYEVLCLAVVSYQQIISLSFRKQFFILCVCLILTVIWETKDKS